MTLNHLREMKLYPKNIFFLQFYSFPRQGLEHLTYKVVA